MKIKLLLGVVLFACLLTLLIEPVPQWQEYHQFSDRRTFFTIPNFFNVISSFSYLLVGAYCLVVLFLKQSPGQSKKMIVMPYLIYAGLIMTGVASVFYHWNPNNETLFWDRLPMAITFMALLSYVLSVFVRDELGVRLLIPLLFFAIFSVIYWRYTESLGRGDLRLYGLVQFLPMLLIPLILQMYGRDKKERKYLWYVIGIYALAKITELFDEQLMNSMIGISGHTLKHIISASAGLVLLKVFNIRRD